MMGDFCLPFRGRARCLALTITPEFLAGALYVMAACARPVFAVAAECAWPVAHAVPPLVIGRLLNSPEARMLAHHLRRQG